MYRFVFLWVIAFSVISCNTIDNLSDSIENIENRVSVLEQVSNQLNQNIIALNDVVNYLNLADYITEVKYISEGGGELGAVLTFSSGKLVTLYYGDKSPSLKLGVNTDEDGHFYWTLDGEVVTNEDGKQCIVGENIPQVKFENNIWLISFDKGLSWIILGDLVGDILINSIKDDGISVIITLNDGQEITIPYEGDAKLVHMRFEMINNPYLLQDDISCEFTTTTTLECRVPHILDHKQLVPTFEFIGKAIFINGSKAESGKTEVDFSKPVSIVVEGNKGMNKEYCVSVYSFTGLPVIRINTEDYANIVSKDDYLNGTFELVEDIVTKGPGDRIKYEVKIKGRGNSTWGLPKKPYKIKFSDKVSLLGEPAEKSWLLLANYTDKSFIRNSIAFYMGLMSKLPYTIKSHFVELFLNERYVGTYLLCEDKDVNESRINLSDKGYLLEIDAKAAPEDITFNITTISNKINIKEPEIEVDSDEYKLVKEFMLNVEHSLFSENFKDSDLGYAQYIDIDSFVDWYLINEIAKNNDASFYSSCYMTWEPGGKLYMGPLWDFDIAFGNVNYNDCQFPEGFWIKNVSWYTRLFEDPVFVNKVKERFDYFYQNSHEVLTFINDSASYLKDSIVENNYVWGTLYNATWPNFSVSGSYENEIQCLKRFFIQRMEWMKMQFDAL